MRVPFRLLFPEMKLPEKKKTRAAIAGSVFSYFKYSG